MRVINYINYATDHFLRKWEFGYGSLKFHLIFCRTHKIREIWNTRDVRNYGDSKYVKLDF